MSKGEKKSISSHLQNIRGCPFPDVPWFKAENIIGAMDYTPRDGDIVMCSYPKTGTTWMQYIIWKILHPHDALPDFNELTYKISPFIEMSGVEVIEKLPPPRFYKHHLRFDLMKDNPKTKFLYVHRNPCDTIASFYHFNNTLLNTTFDFDDFFENFMKGNISYGDYFDHVLSFHTRAEDLNLLLVSYEDLHKDIRGQILRIARYLGEEYHKLIYENESVLDMIVKETSFDFMKKKLSLHLPDENQVERKINFFRKGIIGDGKTLLSVEQSERLAKRIAEKMNGTEFLTNWS